MVRGSGGMLPRKIFESLDPQIAGNLLKLSILPSPRFMFHLKFTIPDHFGSWANPENNVHPLAYGPVNWKFFE